MHMAARFCFRTNVIQNPDHRMVPEPATDKQIFPRQSPTVNFRSLSLDDFRFCLANENTNHRTQRVLVLIMKLMIKRIER